MADSATREKPSMMLTIAQVISELDIPRSTFYRWRAQGKGPKCLKLPNGKVRVRRADLDCFLENCEEVLF